MTQSQVKNSADSHSANEQASGLSVRRRKLLGSVAASPLLLTVASRPVWATGGMCTPSALASANLSGQHEFTGCGISAGFWKTKKSWWPTSPNTEFHSIFGKIRFEDVVIYEKTSVGSRTTLGDVIDLNFTGKNPGNLAFILVGAYLNALAFPSSGGAPGYPYSAQQIVNAFNALDNKQNGDFTKLKNTLDLANNKYDSTTAKPWD